MSTAATEHAAEDQLPLAPPRGASGDFLCWLWAAYPPKAGRLDVRRIAEDLEISSTTVRRWITKDAPRLSLDQVRRVRQRAILRGQGSYLWPDLDANSRRRSELVYAEAQRNDALITEEPERVHQRWHDTGSTSPHLVQIIYFPKAHAFGVSAATHEKAVAKVWRHGRVVESTHVPNKYAAIVLKQEILRRVEKHRCVAPRAMVPTGRTEVWREAGGPATIRRPLEVTVVRFAGLPAEHQVAARLQSTLPQTRTREVVVDDVDQAAAALVEPADVVVLAAPGHTPSSWRQAGTATRWPGGRWYVGGRGSRTAGAPVKALSAAVTARGGVRAGLVVIAAGRARAARGTLRQLGGMSPVLIQLTNTRGRLEQHDLAEVIGRLDLARESTPADLLEGARRFERA